MANTSCKNHSHVGTPNNPAPSVIIVGGGLGGISTAVSLKARGFQVTVVEKNSHIGGRLNTLVKDGFSFDLGPSLTIMPHVFEELFERAGRNVYDYVPFVELNPQWRNFFEDKTRFDLTADFRTQEAELEKIGGAPGYYDYLEYSKRLYSFADKAYFENAADSVWDIIKHEKLKEIWEGTDFLSTMVKGVERYVKNPYLQDVLGFFIKYVGSSSVDAPAILNLLLYSQIGFGLWYIDGGMMNLAKGIEKLMDEMEITVLKETRVRSFIKQGRKVKGVTLEGGKTLMGDLVVSNVEVIPTYRDLMDEPAGHLKKLEKFGPACSGLVVHLGVDKVYPELAHHNFFFSHNTKEHFNDVFHKGILPEDPTTYVVCPTVTDPTLAPKGSSVIKVLPHIPLPEHGEDTNDYDAYLERVLIKLERMGLKDLRKHIVVQDYLTPSDIKDLYESNRGAVYGVVSDLTKNLGFKAPKKSPWYDNLYFVGGSVNPGPGTPMVALCGQQVADLISADLHK